MNYKILAGITLNPLKTVGRVAPLLFGTGDAMRHELSGQMELPQTNARPNELAKLKAAEPLRAETHQRPCYIGLFSDEASQLDLIEMFMD